jgi:hypothetical protein
MTNKYLAACLAAVTAATDLSNGFSVEFNNVLCQLQISQNSQLLWSSDNTVLRSGTGNVDSVTVMVAGNITNFPKVQETLTQEAINCSAQFGETGVVISGDLQKTDGTSTAFTLGFEVESEAKMAISAKIDESAGNWFSLNFDADVDEEIYGMGLQCTEWNFKNKSVPLIISEGGVGRGLQPITRELNIANGSSGGNTMTSYTSAN